ncbi:MULTISPECIES: glycoside hydrolase family 30 beta sandwich domain-containing protein [unclassified Novosphingobium]|uniref:glycoside hydrolase family 30 protein n=1 Tax=unclassified Novosphingobium TaxID=2644732 RepID=UPI00146A7F67|nr:MULTISPECIES: glycoside hydrolase family 30 beta sandwich domain-containing protein [unclassified Novosphingobium]NMN05259.1 glucosylceramidase [Novosphingobium sp. SG919]NMN87554.1 glucosylceramidase [Novosphingobium sp. SG916]
MDTAVNRRGAMALIGMGAAAAGVPGITAAARGAPAPATPARPAVTGASWVATVAGRPWQARPLPALAPVPADLFAVGAQVRLDAPRQTIAGFGGAFSEKGWDALQALPPARRAQALATLFGDDGCAFNQCRTPIGANDISRGWYSYDETPDDYDLAHFSIANDRETLIPFIKAAQGLRPDLKVWASPWSPPTWMKRGGHYAQAPAWPGQPSNGITPAQLGQEGSDSFRLDDRTLATYARYFRRYVEEYAKAGIRIDTVMPQNEFNSAQPFPSCCWTPEGLARFIPFLAQEMDKVGTRVFFGTLERGNVDLFARVMAHPQAAAAIKGIGVQWAGKDALGPLRERYPTLELWGSEQECGVGTNDWRYARYGWQTIRRYFENGASAWTYWNMVMPEGGMSGWGWPQNSLLVVDTKAGTFRMGEDYWLVRHLSAHVRAGARMVPVESFLGYVDQLAFRNPDGSLVLVASNPIAQPATVTYRIGSKTLALPMEADSLNTVVLPADALA